MQHNLLKNLTSWSTYFAPFLSVLYISITFWVKTMFFSLDVCCGFISSSSLLDLNFDMVSCVISIFYIFNVSSLLRIYIQHGKVQRKNAIWTKNTEKYNTKNNPNPNPNPNPNLNSNPNHCSSSFLLWVIKWFWSFEKYNTKNKTRIKHLYNTLIQLVKNAKIQHMVHTTRLYNMLIQNGNFNKMLTSSDTRFSSSKKKRKRKS